MLCPANRVETLQGDPAESIPAAEGKRVFVVHADLRQFYDRVRPDLLAEAIDRVPPGRR